jgi:hypothetical protein
MGMVGGLPAGGWAQEEGQVQTESRAASIVISAAQEGDAGGPPKGVFMMSSEMHDDGSGPVFNSFSFGDVGGNMVLMGGDGLPGGLRIGGLPMFDTDNWGSLLNIPEIRQELDVMDSQMEQIKQARAEMEKSIKTQVNAIMSGGFDPSKAKEMAEIIQSQRSQIEEQVRAQLLPTQIQRLKEVALRLQMKQAGTVGLLGRKDVMEALEISDEQLDALKKKQEKLDAELKERFEALKKKAHEDLLRELKPEQMQKLEAMLGKEFDYQAPEFAPRTPRVRRPAAPAAPSAPAKPLEFSGDR